MKSCAAQDLYKCAPKESRTYYRNTAIGCWGTQESRKTCRGLGWGNKSRYVGGKARVCD
jgi:hypothetical protein